MNSVRFGKRPAAAHIAHKQWALSPTDIPLNTVLVGGPHEGYAPKGTSMTAGGGGGGEEILQNSGHAKQVSVYPPDLSIHI